MNSILSIVLMTIINFNLAPDFEKKYIKLEYIGNSDKPIPTIIISNYLIREKKGGFCYYYYENDAFIKRLLQCITKYSTGQKSTNNMALYKITKVLKGKSEIAYIIKDTELSNFFDCFISICIENKNTNLKDKIEEIKMRTLSR